MNIFKLLKPTPTAPPLKNSPLLARLEKVMFNILVIVGRTEGIFYILRIVNLNWRRDSRLGHSLCNTDNARFKKIEQSFTTDTD